MAKNMLPYPGRFESFDSWDRRCKEWEFNRSLFSKHSTLNGHPNRPERTEFPAKGDSVLRDKNGLPQTFTLPNGKTVEVIARGERARPVNVVRRYAQKHGLQVHTYPGNNATGMCSSQDCIAYRE